MAGLEPASPRYYSPSATKDFVRKRGLYPLSYIAKLCRLSFHLFLAEPLLLRRFAELWFNGLQLLYKGAEIIRIRNLCFPAGSLSASHQCEISCTRTLNSAWPIFSRPCACISRFGSMVYPCFITGIPNLSSARRFSLFVSCMMVAPVSVLSVFLVMWGNMPAPLRPNKTHKSKIGRQI